MERYCFKIEKQYGDKLKEIANKNGLKFSKLVRFIIKYAFLNESIIDKAIAVGKVLEEGVD